jgi:hypothetical protein
LEWLGVRAEEAAARQHVHLRLAGLAARDVRIRLGWDGQ